ncbi:MAG: phosphotransferase [Clostridiaceae bacterium]|nr:phosphotransferase [Clostridiaceae bacterium]
MELSTLLDPYPCIRDIPGSNTWISVHEILNGDSNERKFRVKNQNSQRFMIRLAKNTLYDRKKNEFEYMKRIHELEVPIPQPIAFGICDGGKSIYTMLSWIYGDSDPKRLAALPKEIQYMLGIEAGKFLKTIHYNMFINCLDYWYGEMDDRIKKFQTYCKRGTLNNACSIKIIDYLKENQSLVANQPQTLLHGDFHMDNFVLSYENNFNLIDFEKCAIGDPMADMGPMISRMRQISLPFMIGVLDCYFNYQINVQELRLIAFYASMYALEQMVVTARRGDAEHYQAAFERAKILVKDYNGLKSFVPAWYKLMPPFRPKKRMSGKKDAEIRDPEEDEDNLPE